MLRLNKNADLPKNSRQLKHFAKYLLVVVAVFSSCRDEEQARPDTEYFPLKVGLYRIYSVEENIYSELNPPVLTEYELKTEIVDSFVNQEGGTTFVIHRSTRDTENDPWEFQETWSARLNSYQAVEIEGNVSFVRIVFPASKNKMWDGNVLNALEEDDYVIELSGGKSTLETGVELDDLVMINQEEKLNALVRDEREEVYARGIGLAYKKSVVLNYCDEAGCFGQQIIKDGVEYWQVLKEYGKN